MTLFADHVQETQPVDADLEKQSFLSVDKCQQYGTISTPTSTYYVEAPKKLLRHLLWVYNSFFVAFFVADIAYFVTVDARFPAGLEALYPSEWERQQSVLYTKQNLTCRLWRTLSLFVVVTTIVYWEMFTKVDAAMRSFTIWFSAEVAAWRTKLERVELWKDFCSFCATNLQWVSKVAECFGQCLCCCRSSCCSPCQQCLRDHNWYEIVRGAIYLSLFESFFFLLGTPFMYWRLTIDLEFGFANALTVSTASFLQQLPQELLSMFLGGIVVRCAFLAMLKFRYGWLCMWVGMVTILGLVQCNLQRVAPYIMDMRNPFPPDIFAVGRDFPLVTSAESLGPWASLNRIYFLEPFASATRFATRDHSSGQFVLMLHPKKSWAIAGLDPHSGRARVYASAPAVPVQNLDAATWDQGGHIGVRSGKMLRDKLFAFAKTHNINIVQIYMIDGSHKDARANAFVGGMNGSIIGLYDTLFLGQHETGAIEDMTPSLMQLLVSGESAIQSFSEAMEGLNLETEEHAIILNKAATRAMSDDEIVAILAHELGHPALRHLEQTMLLQTLTSFFTFALVGWAAQSSLLAASLSLSAPVLHVGVAVYDYILGPSIDHVFNLFLFGVSRHNEYEADAFVAKMSLQYGKALQSSLAKLAVNSNQDPDIPLWYEALHSDHPAVARRWAHIESVLASEGSQRSNMVP